MSLSEVFLDRVELVRCKSSDADTEEVLDVLNVSVGEDFLGVFAAIAVGDHDFLDLPLVFADSWVTDVPKFPVNLEQTIHFYNYNQY